MLSKYKTIHILLTIVHLDFRGEVSSNRNASRNESVETGDESVETRDESIEAREKTQQSCYNNWHILDSKFHGANMGPIWGQQDPVGPHIGPMNFDIWDCINTCLFV